MAEEDALYGKFRHLYGGIAPSNMIKFSASLNEAGKPQLECTLPKDTVIDGQTLCTVKGAIIRRKTTDYPKDEFDGDVVTTLTSSGTITDQSTEPNGTYFYAAFPFTTQGVYNRNPLNRAVVNEPKPMKKFEAVSKYKPSTQELYIEITATLPTGIAGAIIRKSTIGYPTSETDGEALKNITKSEVIKDTDVQEGTVYYYSAFPYTSTGAYNRETEPNRTKAAAKKYEYIYGFDYDMSDPNPATCISYPVDCDNAKFKPAKMIFGSKFDSGSWSLKAGEKFTPKPCLLNYDGTVEYYLDPNDYSKQENGQPSRNTDQSVNGNFMMEWGKIFVKRWQTENIYHFRCSDMRQDDDFECWSNYDKNNAEIPRFYTPIYFGSSIGGKLRSLSGKAGIVNNTADQEISMAKANGEDWCIEVFSDRKLLEDLCILMSKSTNSQESFGAGRCQASSAINSGTMDEKGLFWGSSSQTDGVKVFGMENPWGNMWRRTAGWILTNGQQKIKMTRGTKDGSAVNDYNLTGEGYISIPGATPKGTSTGFINKCKVTEYGLIPCSASGSSSTYLCDSLYFASADSSTTKIAYSGGATNYMLSCGIYTVALNLGASSPSFEIGASLSCKPAKK